MSDRPPISVLLPTREWTDACREVADQLRPGDELLVVCDDRTDPVVPRARARQGVDLVVAGEPRGCSGKANAVAAGMRRASNERVVWTDDDFRHPPTWLEDLSDLYERHGPVSEVPFFRGRDPLSMLLEPLYAVGVTRGLPTSDLAWGGGVIFERSDLAAGESALLADLERSMSDDGTLSEHLDVTPLPRTRVVPVGGTMRESLERHVRFVHISRRHGGGGWWPVVVSLLVTVGALLAPLGAAAVLTPLTAAVYYVTGVRRWTFLLALPTAVLQGPLLLYALSRQTFRWGSRRYRWRDRHEVRVLE